jgi:hypothetical protein
METPPFPIEDLPLKSAHLLRGVARELRIDPADKPQEYLLILHAFHIVQLAEEIVFLLSHNHHTASPVIARAIYESLFKLGLVLEKPELSAEKALREMEWSLIQDNFKGAQPKELKEIRTRPRYAPIGKLVLNLGERWKLKNSSITSDKVYSTFWCAQKANMLQFYQRQYAQLSAFAHASCDTFVTAHFHRTNPVIVHVTLAINEALIRIVKKYRAILPPELVQEATAFDRLLRHYGKTGHIKQFLLREFIGIGPSKPTSAQRKFQTN